MINDHISSFIGVICKTAVEKVAEKAQEEFNKQVFEKCAALRHQAEKQLLDEEKGIALEQKCLDTAGVQVDEDAESQKTNYTDQCISTLKNASQGSWSEVNRMVQEFMENNTFGSDLNSLIGEHLSQELSDLEEEATKEEPEAGAGAGDEKTEEPTEEPSETSSENETEKPSATSSEKTTEKPSATSSEKPTEEPERLFNSAVHIPRTVGAGYAAFTCLFGGAFAAAVGLVVVLRRGVRGSRDAGHDSLIDEESEVADA
jgi:hypothetical protein